MIALIQFAKTDSLSQSSVSHSGRYSPTLLTFFFTESLEIDRLPEQHLSFNRKFDSAARMKISSLISGLRGPQTCCIFSSIIRGLFVHCVTCYSNTQQDDQIIFLTT